MALSFPSGGGGSDGPAARRLLGNPIGLSEGPVPRRLKPTWRLALRAIRAGSTPPKNTTAQGLGPWANHGGGGSRTRVRIWVLQSLYVRRSLSISPRRVSDQPIPGPAASWSRPPARQHDRRTSPICRRLRGPPRAGDPRDGLVSDLTQPMPDQSWQLKCFPIVSEGRGLGTLLHVHQTRRNRDAPDGLPAHQGRHVKDLSNIRSLPTSLPFPSTSGPPCRPPGPGLRPRTSPPAPPYRPRARSPRPGARWPGRARYVGDARPGVPWYTSPDACGSR